MAALQYNVTPPHSSTPEALRAQGGGVLPGPVLPPQQQQHFQQQQQHQLQQQQHNTPSQQGVLSQPSSTNATPTQSKSAHPLPPPSPNTQRDQQRFSLLLDINNALLKEVVQHQESGRSGLPQQQPSQDPSNPDPTAEGQKKPTQESIEYVSTILSICSRQHAQLHTSNPSQLPPPPPSKSLLPRLNRRAPKAHFPSPTTSRSPGPRHHVLPQRAPGPGRNVRKIADTFPRVERPTTWCRGAGDETESESECC
ncbi:hypothetical protein K402DRAFT_109323 [Aulographum hederae CBS 113979]|uniref:Uncharacterized protein n=1 Tax=Aulographum hederae CBS 113979 TaxID=1176131 RepID=A0A6G1GWW2_9PEZI|nr:hypothetical protein K402DRAFT_109323 [Aulographum hederae CBS 113979]